MGLTLIAARWLIAALFLRSGFAKAADSGAFRSAVANYQILPLNMVKVVAAVLPAAEIVAGIMLAAGIVPVVIASILAILLLAFAASIAVNLARGRVFDCGCTGSAVAPSSISWRHAGLDVVLAAISAAVAIGVPPTAEAWPGLSSPVHSAAHASDMVPLLLVVTLVLIGAMLLRRALALRTLAGSIMLRPGSPAMTESRRP
jgi:hypothetical protein